MNSKKTILLTNDDGYSAPGIESLREVLYCSGSIIIVAPEKEQSGVGHAFTYNKPLHYRKIDAKSVPAYIVNGTPADCVKFAVSYLLPQRPDVVISGMNVGENSGLSAFYSGTVAAAREGAFWNVPSMAFSVCKESARYIKEYAAKVPSLMKRILEVHESLKDKKVYYNVNFPPCAPEQVRGTKVTRQSLAFFEDRYERIEVESQNAEEGFLIYGEKKDIEPSDIYDSRALMNNYIAISPLMFDATAREVLPHLAALEEQAKR